MRFSSVPSINLAAHVERNREIISRLPQPKATATKVWSPAKLRFV